MYVRRRTSAASAHADTVRVVTVREIRLLAVGLLMAATTACGGAVGSEAPPPGAAAAPASPESGPAVRPDRPPVPNGKPTPSRTGTAPANRRPRTTAPAAPAVPGCATRDLTVSEGQTGLPASGESGWFGTPIQLRNHSGSACRLRGWPGLTFYGDGTIRGCAKGDASTACGKPLSTSGTRPFTITRSSARSLPDILLTPGRTTTFTLVWQGSYSCGAYVDSPYGVDIRVPGDSHALTLIPATAISPCEGRIEVTPFGVVG
ncbi:DUF4232 domain-containing protein [Streptomyces diastatochromogenes]|uniref:DUF4232 domain-containing protein n=1 Tax=Streptomyces diastatochromogenes TaxID=42236 RepID=UPI0036BCCD86